MAAHELSVYDGAVEHLTTLLAINVVLWALSLMIGKAWPVDFVWSSWPIYQSYLLATEPHGGSDGHGTTAWRSWAVVAVVTLWGQSSCTECSSRCPLAIPPGCLLASNVRCLCCVCVSPCRAQAHLQLRVAGWHWYVTMCRVAYASKHLNI